MERGVRFWHRLRRNRLAENVLALYVVQFSNYLLPLIAVPYTVRVLTPSGYGLGAFAQSFASFFGIFSDYGFNLTATRAVSINRDNSAAVSRIVSDVLSAKTLIILLCALAFWLLTLTVPQLRRQKLVEWMAFLILVANTFFPSWLFQGLEELRSSARVSLWVRIGYLPALFLFVRRPQDTWKWVLLLGVTSLVGSAVAWYIAGRHLHVRMAKPTWSGVKRQLREGFSLFVSQAAVSLYTTANAAILGFFTNMTVVGYYSAAEKLARTAVGVFGPITQSVYPRAAMLAASARDAALRLTRQMVVLMGVLGFVLSIGLAVIAPWACPILLGSNFLPSVTITQILSPLPFFVAVSNVLGIQVMIPFKHDRAFTSILGGAGVFNVALGVLLAPRWQGNGMALSATLSEFLVTAAMLFHMTRHGLAPWSKAQPEAANV